MKIFYTKQFKEDILKPYKILELGRYRLRYGETPGFAKINSNGVQEGRFSKDLSPSSSDTYPISIGSGSNIVTYYESQFLEYYGRFQISLDLPKEDRSIFIDDPNYSEQDYYQVLVFYYRDITNGEDEATMSIAFLIYENFEEGYEGTGLFDSKDGRFYGLRLTSFRNIFTTPQLSWNCTFIFPFYSEIVNHLENEWGQDRENIRTVSENDGNEVKYFSIDSWKKYWIDQISTENDTPWSNTTYVNKFGLKIY